MKSLTHIALALLIAFMLLPAAASAGNCNNNGNGNGPDNCFILRAEPADVPALATAYGLTVVGQLSASDPDAVLVTGPTSLLPEDTLDLLEQDPDVIGAEIVSLASLSENEPGATIDMAQVATLDAITLEGAYVGSENTYFTSATWSGYMEQPAVGIIKQQLVRDPAVPESRPPDLPLFGNVRLSLA